MAKQIEYAIVRVNNGENPARAREDDPHVLYLRLETEDEILEHFGVYGFCLVGVADSGFDRALCFCPTSQTRGKKEIRIPERFRRLPGKHVIHETEISKKGNLSEDDVVRYRYIENGAMFLVGCNSDEFGFSSLSVGKDGALFLRVTPKETQEETQIEVS